METTLAVGEKGKYFFLPYELDTINYLREGDLTSFFRLKKYMENKNFLCKLGFHSWYSFGYKKIYKGCRNCGIVFDIFDGHKLQTNCLLKEAK